LSQIREGRFQTLDQCLLREHRMTLQAISRQISGDFCEVQTLWISCNWNKLLVFLLNISLFEFLLGCEGTRGGQGHGTEGTDACNTFFSFFSDLKLIGRIQFLLYILIFSNIKKLYLKSKFILWLSIKYIQWDPPTLEKVSQDMVDQYFLPLSEFEPDLELPTKSREAFL
jgi:hypothetical protein